MAEVTVLKTRPVVIQESIVSLLEDWLADAKAGELKCVAAAGIGKDGAIIIAWSDTASIAETAGAIARLEHRFQASVETEVEFDDDEEGEDE